MAPARTLDTPFDEAIANAIESTIADGGDEERILTALDNGELEMDGVVEQCAESLVESLKRAAPEMLGERRASRMDYAEEIEEHWGDAFDLLAMLVRIAYEAGDDFNEKHRLQAIADDDPVYLALVRLHARGCRIVEEILVLLRGGFGEGARGRWRVLHEVVVVARFIADCGRDVAARYLAHDRIDAWRGMQSTRRAGFALREPESSELDQRVEMLVSRYGGDFKNNYGWAAKALREIDEVKDLEGFAAIEKAVEMSHHRPYFWMASIASHGGSRALFMALDQHPDDSCLLAGPSALGLAPAGQGACIALVNLTATLLTSRTTSSVPFILSAMLKLSDEANTKFAELGSDAVDVFDAPS